MPFKFESKEKFHVLTPSGPELTDALTDKIEEKLREVLKEDVKNLVINLVHVNFLTGETGVRLAGMQELFYANDASFVCCNVGASLATLLKEHDIYDILNIVPTESEAWDMVQMEEIERELLKDEEEE